MARGDMGLDVLSVTYAEILNREPFEAVPMTLDFTGVSEVGENGKKIVKAGTPIKADGTKDATATAPAGILLHDVYEDYPTGAILKKAYINTARCAEASGLTYNATLIGAVTSALPMIVFE